MSKPGQFANQFSQFYRNLTAVKSWPVMAAIVVAMMGVAMAVILGSGSNHVPLFTNVPGDQFPQIVEQLQKRGIPFKISDNGSTILVPKELLHSTEMSIMTELGGANIGHVGLELFDKQDFGATSYTQKINYQRALQGELMRAINTLDAVKQSKVILALPQKKTFLEEGGQPSASVVVDMRPGKGLAPEQVRGITFLVSSAVEGLQPEKVTVVDSRGKVLSKHYGAESALSGELLDMKQKVEGGLEERIEAVLSRVVGQGKVIARVDATLNPRSSQMTEEEVNADAAALKSQQTEKESTTSSFEVPKTVRNVREAAGTVERLSVAVLVDGISKSVAGKDGQAVQQWSPRTPEEMKKFEQVVKSAIGYNAARGDTVTVENIAFQKEDFSEAENMLATLENSRLPQALTKWLLIAFGLIMTFFAVLRPFMRWITEGFQDTIEDILPRTIEELEELHSGDDSLPGMDAALPVIENMLDPDKTESELLRERIMGLMDHDTEKAAGAFSLWLSRREL
jgi:flagellar M-ring protein FliF